MDKPSTPIGVRAGIADPHRRTIVVDAPKTGQRRAVRLLEPLSADLQAWRGACSGVADAAVFPAADGSPWSANAFEKWRCRCFNPGIEETGLQSARPYDLRHSFASLLLHEGRSVIYVARQLGHGAELTMGTYGHVTEELEDQPQLPAEVAIQEARAQAAREVGGLGSGEVS